ncbi:hypothetical protein [Nocardia sp. NPDC005366]|uniref:hypothetical protein n=1 Tax=Nocardia sp. NPDC005366 TaxID=3156878 RepID=UPI0033B7487D
MHPDPQPGPEPVTHVIQRPQFVTQADGVVRAYYPGEDWWVTGSDRDDAITRLVAESQRRLQDPAYLDQHWETTLRHKQGLEHTPGFEVREISPTEYQRHTELLGEQLRDAGESG